MSIQGTVRRVLIMTMASSLGCLAQNVSFGLASGSGNPGSTVTLDISMASSTGALPASVEWTVNYPASDFSSVTAVPGAVAAGANKSVSCTGAAGSSTCVLWGDNNIAMANGVVASLSLVVSGSTQDTSAQIQLSVPMSANPSGFPLPTSATGSTVTIVQPSGLSGFACLPVSVAPPATSTCTVQLSASAPAGGAAIALAASPADVNIPPVLAIAQGSSSASFTVTPSIVNASTPVNLTASYLGVTEGFGLTVNPPVPVLTGLSITPSVLADGQSGTGLVTLSAPAGTGGALVSVSSSNGYAVSGPTSVMVAPGATTASFAVLAGAVAGSTPVVMTGSYAGVSLNANMTVTPPQELLSSMSINPTALVGSVTATGTITLSFRAGPGGATVALSSSNTSAAAVPASVTVASGSTTATFSVATSTVTTLADVLLTASYSGSSVTTNLTVEPRPHALTAIQFTPSAIQSGQSATGTVTLAAPAGAGGVVVYLYTSNASAVTVPTSVTVAQGSTTASFMATAGNVSSNITVAITAYHAGLRETTYLTVRAHQAFYGQRGVRREAAQ